MSRSDPVADHLLKIVAATTVNPPAEAKHRYDDLRAA
jgi:hypothetical protein